MVPLVRVARTLAFAIAALAVAAPGTAGAEPTTCDARWTDAARNRVVPVRIRMPVQAGRHPVVLFSHGLGGSLEAGTDWVNAWAQAGLITVNVQHAGSDSGVWRGQARPLAGLRDAMNGQQLQARAADVRFVLDRLAQGGHEGACDLDRVDLQRIGMAGHSFGAQTTLAVSGARYGGAAIMQDTRIRAALALSPQPAQGQDDRAAFGAISVPFFSITGTRDALPWLNEVTAEDRTRPFAAMPAGHKYLLVLEGANHMMLGGQRLHLPDATANAHIVDLVTRMSTDFWRAWLLDDSDAARRLDSGHYGLTARDRYERG